MQRTVRRRMYNERNRCFRYIINMMASQEQSQSAQKDTGVCTKTRTRTICEILRDVAVVVRQHPRSTDTY
jgi:hypothetical protein